MATGSELKEGGTAIQMQFLGMRGRIENGEGMAFPRKKEKYFYIYM